MKFLKPIYRNISYFMYRNDFRFIISLYLSHIHMQFLMSYDIFLEHHWYRLTKWLKINAVDVSLMLIYDVKSVQILSILSIIWARKVNQNQSILFLIISTVIFCNIIQIFLLYYVISKYLNKKWHNMMKIFLSVLL